MHFLDLICSPIDALNSFLEWGVNGLADLLPG